MELGLTGGCLCGGVRYECAAEPMLPGHCQCRDCQKDTGTGHSSHFGVPAGALKLSGELRAYETTADSGRVATRGFCPNCGSPILFRTSGLPDVVFLTPGSLDDPALFKPGIVVFGVCAALGYRRSRAAALPANAGGVRTPQRAARWSPFSRRSAVSRPTIFEKRLSFS